MSADAPEAVTLQLPAATWTELDDVSRIFGRDRSSLVSDAVDAYLAEYRLQTAEIEAGMREAEAGELATDAEIEAIRARHR